MNITAILAQLQKITYAFHPLSSEVWNAFAGGWQPYIAKRKTMITAAGDTEKYLYFVAGGVQRAFYLTEEKEATLVLTYPYSFSGVLDSFLLQTPSKYYLETLTQSQFLRTSFTHINFLMQQHHSFETFIRKALSITVAGALERQIELQCFSAEQKFKTLLKRSPHVLQLVPHKYLASYLGIDATTFSKLLGSVRL